MKTHSGSPSPALRFRATIEKARSNPYVDVPAAVGRAFGRFAVAGRIRVEGTLEGTAIRGMLVPLAGGGHRLYVNGGMRAAAGVEEGDRVTFVLRARRHDDVRPSRESRDLARALAAARGVRAKFDALSPAHRHELLRYIDDARTSENRRRRIERTIDQLAGRPIAAGRRKEDRQLWACPKCGNEFVNKNQWHSCKCYELSDSFGESSRSCASSSSVSRR